MQTCRRFIQDIEGITCLFFRKFGSELYSLRLTPRKRRRLLPKTDIAEPNLLQCLHFIINLRYRLEEFHCFIYRHLKNIRNRLPFIPHFQCFSVKSLPVAGLAMHKNIRKEVHFNNFQPTTLAGLASSSFYIKREPPRLVTTDFTLWKCRK